MFPSGYAIYFENAAVRVLEHPADFAIFQYRPGPRSLLDLQAAVTHFDHLLRRRQWWKVLNDQRHMQPFTEEETAWVHRYWQTRPNPNPRGLSAGVLLAQDVFARLSAGQLRHGNQAADLNIAYHVFDTEAEAVAWLQQLD